MQRWRADEHWMEQVDRASLLSAVLESIEDGVLAKTLNARISFWNHGAEQLFGYTATEMIGQSIFILVPSGRHAEEERILANLRDGKRTEHPETVRLRKDGTEVPVSLFVSPIKSAEGTIVGGATIMRDMTAHRLAEERFRLVFEASPSGKFLVAHDGKIKLANSAAEIVFGYAKLDMLEQPLEVVLPAYPQLQRDHEPEQGLLVPDKAPMIARELWGVRKDGTRIPIELRLFPIATESGEFTLAVIVDITERKLAADLLARQTHELERSNAELEQFAYVASHDLQEPLRMVVSYTELLKQRNMGRLDEKSDKFIRYIVDGGKRMQGLVNDLLRYSRVGRESRAFETVDTARMVSEVLLDLDGTIKATGAEIDRGPLPRVAGDAVELRQLFQNLISNGLKFRAERPPRIAINAECAASESRFCVEDNGIGIEAQYSQRIFQMFQRLHEREAYEGNGIGLALAKKIVERHGGRIWFESQYGQGTKFFFTLPLVMKGIE